MIHFPVLDYILWASSFILASVISWRFFSRHMLTFLLPFWLAAGGAVEFLASLFGLHSYARAYYVAQVPLLALEAALGVYLAGMMLRDRSRAWSVILGLGAAALIAARHHDLTLFVPRIMDTELYLAGGIGLIVTLAYWSSEVEPDEPHGWIAAGLVLMLMGQVLGAGLIHHFGLRYWALTSRVQPLGEIAGLLAMGWAALQRTSELWVIRLPFEKPKSLRVVGEA